MSIILERASATTELCIFDADSFSVVSPPLYSFPFVATTVTVNGESRGFIPSFVEENVSLVLLGEDDLAAPLVLVVLE